MHLKKVFMLSAESVLKLCLSRSSTKTACLPKRTVLVSDSKSIFENLALEEWLYDNTDFTETEHLLMWRNQPAVVLGRHQNPWLEANIPYAREEGVDIARRGSGGGTVYHDEGNLNLSFLTNRTRYNRRANLDLVVEGLTRKWDVDLSVNKRDDIMLERFYKISGTAAKLGRVQSFHHCTLLVNVDQGKLIRCLESPMLGVDSKSTKSIPSTVINLKDKVPDLTFELLVEVIGKHYLSRTDLVSSQTDFQYVNPTDMSKFPGVDSIAARLKSWQWVYGKTPKFSVRRTFAGIAFSQPCTLEVTVQVENGIARSLSVNVWTDNKGDKLESVVNTVQSFYSTRVSNELKLLPECISEMQMKNSEFILSAFSASSVEVASWVSKCVGQCLQFV